MTQRLRRGSKNWVGVAAALLLLQSWSGEASAKGIFSEIGDLKIYALRGMVNVPPPTSIALTDAAEPTWYKVPSGPDQTIGEILSQECGFQQPETQKYLEERIVSLNLAAGLDAIVKPEEVVAVPFCLKITLNRSVTVQPGDNPAKILAREYGVSGPKSVEAFFQANLGKSKYHTLEEFEKYLTANDRLILPYASDQQYLQQYVSEASELKSAKEIIAGMDDPHLRDLMTSNFAEVGAEDFAAAAPATDFRNSFFYIPSVDLFAAPSGSNCGGKADEVAVLADAKLFADRMTLELAARKAFNHSEDEPQATTIGIVDSGLSRGDDGFFQEKLFNINTKEIGKNENEDHDGNTFKGDVYGVNLVAGVGDLTPNPSDTDEDRAHGTEMAALALGGMTIGPMWNAARTNPLVKLKIVNFSNNDQYGGLAPANRLQEAIDYLTRHKAEVINLSLGTNEKLFFLNELFLNPKPRNLFVVAAGNDPKKGGDLATTKLYPARLGKGSLGTVVVGASNLDGAPAYFSNRSNLYVDFLAPGCAVPTRDDRGKNVVTNGTSQATAITSFAAGIIHALGVDEPTAIKNRLIASVDFDPALSQDVSSSGRLNIVKAVTLYHDVIDLHGTAGPEVGILAKPEKLFAFCKEAPPIKAEMIRKVLPNLIRDEGASIEFWYELDDILDKESCLQQKSNESIGDIIVDGQAVPGPALSDVKEITIGNFATRP